MRAVRVRVVDARTVRTLAPRLADVLVDCVDGGASVSFMAPLSSDEANAFWTKVADAVERNLVSVVVAEIDGAVAGTVQVAFDTAPNQPHRAEIRKLLVHRRARGQGLGKALMRAAEEEAVARGKSLLCLDTASAAAARIYADLGWCRVGVIPDYALLPHGGFCDTTIYYKRIA
jgi:GNAT superfamily N-acetyltransferase